MMLSRAALALALAGCSGGPTPVDSGPPQDAIATESSVDATVDHGLPDQSEHDSIVPDVARDVPMDTAPSCVLTASYSYGYQGGNAPSVNVSHLTPTNGWRRTDDATGSDAMSQCAVAIPMCGSDAGIALDTVLGALEDPDVAAALASPTATLFGIDPRPADGEIWSFMRADGRGFLLGDPCGTGDDACTMIPPGVATLAGILSALDAQQLGDPSCAGIQ